MTRLWIHLCIRNLGFGVDVRLLERLVATAGDTYLDTLFFVLFHYYTCATPHFPFPQKQAFVRIFPFLLGFRTDIPRLQASRRREDIGDRDSPKIRAGEPCHVLFVGNTLRVESMLQSRANAPFIIPRSALVHPPFIYI